ncbi:MAG: hypothetical protein ACOC2U_04120, partial [bacterium]
NPVTFAGFFRIIICNQLKYRIMDIINVIVSEKQTGFILSVDSFPVHEEQLKDDVVSEAEKRYVNLCIENGIDEVDAEESIENGSIDNTERQISFVWSYAH